MQANFIVPSSREAVDSNSAWNEELRGHLPELFCKALASFKALPAQDGLLWVNRWLLCIPLQGEVQDVQTVCLAASSSVHVMWVALLCSLLSLDTLESIALSCLLYQLL